jgi:hypothetical protein
MKAQRLFSSVVAVGTIGMLYPAIAWAAAQVPPSAPVTVVNKPSNPVPVTIQGTGTVSGSVSITNEVSVRDSDNPAFQPVSVSIHPLLEDGTASAATGLVYTVPAGKRLVIEHAAGELSTTPASNTGRAYLRLDASTDNSTVSLPVGTTNESAPCTLTQACLAISKPVRLYADPGATIFYTLGYLISQSSQFNRGTITISGYLVDIE